MAKQIKPALGLYREGIATGGTGNGIATTKVRLDETPTAAKLDSLINSVVRGCCHMQRSRARGAWAD